MYIVITIDPSEKGLELIQQIDKENKPDAVFEEDGIKSSFVNIIPEAILKEEGGFNKMVKEITGIDYDPDLMKVTLDKCQSVNTYLTFRTNEECAKDDKCEFCYGVEGEDSTGTRFSLDYDYGVVNGDFATAYNMIMNDYKVFEAKFKEGKDIL